MQCTTILEKPGVFHYCQEIWVYKRRYSSYLLFNGKSVLPGWTLLSEALLDTDEPQEMKNWAPTSAMLQRTIKPLQPYFNI